MMTITRGSLAALLVVGLMAGPVAAQPQSIALWAGGAPGASAASGTEQIRLSPQGERIVTGVRGRRPKDILAAPTEIADGPASPGIQRELRRPATQHQKILVDAHRAVWRGGQPAAGNLTAAEARVLPRVHRF